MGEDSHQVYQYTVINEMSTGASSPLEDFVGLNTYGYSLSMMCIEVGCWLEAPLGLLLLALLNLTLQLSGLMSRHRGSIQGQRIQDSELEATRHNLVTCPQKSQVSLPSHSLGQAKINCFTLRIFIKFRKQVRKHAESLK